jgi:hypothetical protein
MNWNSTGRIVLSLFLLLMLTMACGGTVPEAVKVEPTSEPAPTVTELPPAEELTPESEPVGSSPNNPLPSFEKLTTSDWEIQVLEVLRGEDALTALKQVSASNDAPEAGTEYLLVKVHVRYIGVNTSAFVYSKVFRSLGSAGEMYKTLSFTKVNVPEPELEADLAPGEETEGWIAFAVTEGETELVLVLWPYESYENNTAVFIDSAEKWYIALE